MPVSNFTCTINRDCHLRRYQIIDIMLIWDSSEQVGPVLKAVRAPKLYQSREVVVGQRAHSTGPRLRRPLNIACTSERTDRRTDKIAYTLTMRFTALVLAFIYRHKEMYCSAREKVVKKLETPERYFWNLLFNYSVNLYERILLLYIYVNIWYQ